jgi:putative flippase GtrA
VRQFLVFVVVGLSATIIQYGVLVAGVELIGLSAPVSSGVGFVVSSVVNYLLNYRLTFRSSRTHTSAGSRFAVVALGGLLINVACIALLVEHWRVQYVLAQVFATALAFFWTYCGNALWSFTNPRTLNPDVDRKEA